MSILAVVATVRQTLTVVLNFLAVRVLAVVRISHGPVLRVGLIDAVLLTEHSCTDDEVSTN